MPRSLRRIAILLLATAIVPTVRAGPFGESEEKVRAALGEANGKIRGHIVDFTNNHGCDRRLWSCVLGQKRDLYVYLPPEYDGVKQYPFMLFLHGLVQDEKVLLATATDLDCRIVAGSFPPVILAIPDGTPNGYEGIYQPNTFFLNSKLGRFEDYVIRDVVPFVLANFAVRPEREAHVLAGVSMGGYSAFNLGIKYRDRFGVVAGLLPLLNPRYCDCHGNRFAPFDPNCVGWVEKYQPLAVMGRVKGWLPIREHRVVGPLFDHDQVIARVSQENPVEMLDRYDVRPGELRMFVAFCIGDEFNADAQAESFMYTAAQRGLTVDRFSISGSHGRATGLKLFGAMGCWLIPILRPYIPLPTEGAP